MDLNVVDADPPFRADCIPGELPVGGDGVKTVHDGVTMSTGDELGWVANTDTRTLHQDVCRRGSRRDDDWRHRPQPRDIAEDAVAGLAAEVVVDHLRNPAVALGVYRCRRPQAGDPLGGRGGHTYRSGGARQNRRGEGEHDDVETSVPPGSRPTQRRRCRRPQRRS
jgi:hypothetical protein